MNSRVDKGRKAVAERAWREAHAALAAAHREEPLAPEDLWLLAMASYLVGQERDYRAALHEAHDGFLEADRVLEAVRSAFWLGDYLASRGDLALASGWFGRAARVVKDREPEGAARGYVMIPVGHRQLIERDYEGSAATSERAAEIGRRCRDPDLAALGVHLQGRALLRAGRLDEGLALLDEAMVAVAGEELTPVAKGLIYCSVLSACREVYALRRAAEWTTALAEWCEKQPEMVAYTGPCLVSRAEILQRRGEWSRAEDEARLAVRRFDQGSGPGTAGPAHYQQAEIHRLRGEHAAAEQAYQAAAECGREPQPGLALLRMAQGAGPSAAASMRRALAEVTDPLRRAQLLPAYVEILLERGDVEGADRAAEELAQIAEAWDGRVLKTLAAHARGAVELTAGDAAGALVHLRRACQEWHEMDAPYDAAKARALLAAACRALGDDEGADMELKAAHDLFRRLGAAPDLAKLGAGGASTEADHGLTAREREVLRWLATGRTNRAIGQALHISEKTVARHVANIYGKLGVSSRAAATAYAYEHDLTHPPA